MLEGLYKLAGIGLDSPGFLAAIGAGRAFKGPGGVEESSGRASILALPDWQSGRTFIRCWCRPIHTSSQVLDVRVLAQGHVEEC